MKIICIALSLALLLNGTTALADTTVTPDWVRQNTGLLNHGACTDQESGEQGYCYLSRDAAHHYLTFTPNGVPIFIRRDGEFGYEQVWPEYRPGGSEL